MSWKYCPKHRAFTKGCPECEARLVSYLRYLRTPKAQQIRMELLREKLRGTATPRIPARAADVRPKFEKALAEMLKK